MSNLKKPISEMGVDSVGGVFKGVLSCEENKPDFKELNLGSPVAPLRTSRGGKVGGGAVSGISTTTSSSSSSSGSVSGKNGNNSVARRSDGGGNSHSGELTASGESSLNAADTIYPHGSIDTLPFAKYNGVYNELDYGGEDPPSQCLPGFYTNPRMLNQ